MAYCNNCGNQILEGSKFCPNCGAEVYQYYDNRYLNNGINTRLIYKSGCGSKLKYITVIILVLIMCALSAWIMYLSSSTDSQRFVFGGIHKEPMLLLMFGVILFCFGIIMISLAINHLCCWTKIYDNHIEAKVITLGGLGINRKVIIYSNQINSISREGKYVLVFVSGNKYKLSCKDPDKVCQIIAQMCSWY